MKHKWIAVLAAACFVAGWLAGGDYPVEAQSVQPVQRYQAINLDSGVLLWDTETGDSWRMSGMIDRGWVYRALPERIDGCMIGLRGCSP